MPLRWSGVSPMTPELTLHAKQTSARVYVRGTMSWMDAPAERDAWLAVMASLEGSETPEELLSALLEDDGDTAKATDHVHAPSTPFSRSSSASSEHLVDTGDTQAPTKTKRKKKRTPCRVRTDLEMLRKTVSDLKAYLAVLEARNQARINASARPIGGLSMAGGSVQQRSQEIWREVATRQYRWRRESEVENERLRGALDEQQKIARGLEKLLKRSYSLLGKVTPITWHPVEVEGAQYARRIHELMMITFDMYTFASEVLIAKSVSSAHAEVPLRTLPISTTGSLPPQYSVADSSAGRYVPCPPQAITNGLWDYFCARRQNSDSYFREHVEATDDCVIKSFQLHWNSDSTSVNHQGIVVARKLRHPSGGDVVLYTAELEPIEMPPSATTPFSEAALSTGGFRTRGWAVIRPSDTDGEEHDAMVSEVIFKTITTPIDGAADSSATSHSVHASRSRLTSLVQFSLSRHHERMQRAIDKVLMSR